MFFLNELKNFRSGDHEPRGKLLRMFEHALFELVERDPPQLFDLRAVKVTISAVAAEKDMVVFILEQVVGVLRKIDEAEQLADRACNAEFFEQSSRDGLIERFSESRVGTAGVRPQTARMVFVAMALLDQHFVAVGDENRKGAMKPA